MREMARGLASRGVPKDQIRYEFFGKSLGTGAALFDDEVNHDDLPDAVDAEGRPITVTFARTGLSVPWKAGLFSLLSLAERSGLPSTTSCRTGLCGSCVCRLDGGEVDYVVEPLERPGAGEVMICCARPLTSVMLNL